MGNSTVLAAALAASMSCAMTASADIIFNNFGPDDLFDLDSGPVVGGDLEVQHASAMPPILAGDFLLNSVTAALSHISGANMASLVVWDDAGGEPGSVIEQVAAGDFGSFPTNDMATEFVFSGTSILEEGATYWIGVIGDGDAELLWGGTVPKSSLPHVFNLGGGPWVQQGNAPTGAFRVEGTLVPAPGALALLCLGGFAGCAVTRRRALG